MKGDVTSSVMLQGKDGQHRFYVDHDGQRPGYTTLTSPGTFAVKWEWILTPSKILFPQRREW